MGLFRVLVAVSSSAQRLEGSGDIAVLFTDHSVIFRKTPTEVTCENMAGNLYNGSLESAVGAVLDNTHIVAIAALSDRVIAYLKSIGTFYVKKDRPYYRNDDREFAVL